MSKRERLRGLYVITETTPQSPHSLIEKVLQAIKGGAAIVQYRDKSTDMPRRREEASHLARLCRKHEVLFLINDDVELALQSGADGVHLGQQDAPLAQARQKLGHEKTIGITCHDNLQLAKHAQSGGADYVAFGRFFPSRTKSEAPPASTQVLLQAKQQLTIPIVAIGGISEENGACLVALGTDMLAVSHSVFGQANVTQAASRLARLFIDVPYKQLNDRKNS